MRFCLLILGLVGLSTLGLYGCANAPGHPGPDGIPVIPSEISDFNVLYGQNCAGCHGPEGKRGGAAIALGDPVYLAIAYDAVVRRAVSNGIPGTSMPAFAHSAGGMLTDQQIYVIVHGIRERWSKPDLLRGANPPSHSPTGAADSSRVLEVYAGYCSSCHGSEGRGGQKESSIVDGSVLA